MASTSFRIYENAVSQGPLFHITWCPGCQMKPNVKIYLQKVTMGELFRWDGNTHSKTSNGTQMFGQSDRGVTNSTFEIHNVFIACSNHIVLYKSTAKCNTGNKLFCVMNITMCVDIFVVSSTEIRTVSTSRHVYHHLLTFYPWIWH